ncbi:hypothetical protein [Coraliomargarita akajimensis]|uniref:Uncharacterized protein n=1 Tax=Coraliomargarita akajimensis (strain DSM 45221 / IAM 15411 / JCM 23193 / KCTC 12865 / 04OKA010-24) TaxID=583355 RepID=D5EHU3_CORAD|nr:hypothetical protein [Coraliomargarita akajimensis]ADE54134.1 hypothetical protein Caka_1113 [Coraliomargarita akajimensis DSM 45221]
MQRTSGKILGIAIAFTALATAAILGLSFYFSGSTIHELLTENHQLSKAIRNLTAEESIAYATLQSQQRDANGQLVSTLRFVQTASGNPKQIVSEQLFEISGETAHFDCLIVKFAPEYVQEGKERALFLWRRIYGEQTPPSEGAAIEIPGTAPERYYNITKALRMSNQSLFWEAIWNLANDPDALSQYGVHAVFGNALYLRLEYDRLYQFKVNASGQIYPEVIDVR